MRATWKLLRQDIRVSQRGLSGQPRSVRQCWSKHLSPKDKSLAEVRDRGVKPYGVVYNLGVIANSTNLRQPLDRFGQELRSNDLAIH